MARRTPKGSHATAGRWRGRPVLAGALQTALVLLPVLAATVVVRAAAVPLGGAHWLLRLSLGLVLAVGTAMLAERLLRRFLPLAALLRMTMLFPDRAPSRVAVARRIGHPRQLADLAAGSRDETLAEAAERILVLVATLGAHDRRTRGHSERVRVFTDLVSEQLGLDREARDRLRWAALLHDLGKVAVPARVLNKPGALDAGEWDLIRTHPAEGLRLAGPLVTWLGPWAAAIGEHHERFDGTGYPRGLRGHGIALAGRVVAVADTFEVMTAARSYKRPMSVRAARVELARVAGTQLDPVCVRALLAASLPRLLWAVGPVSLLVNLPFLRSVADAGRLLDPAGLVGPATTTAAAALTGVAVVASPLASPAAASDARPLASKSSVQHANSAAPTTTPGAPGSSGTGAPGGAPTAARPSASPRPDAVPRPTGSSSPPPAAPTPTAPTPTAPGGGSASPRPGSGATPRDTPSGGPTPTATASPSPTTTSNSGPGKAGEDRTPPVVTITAAPVLRLLTGTASVTFTSDDTSATFTCRLDGDPWRSCTSPVTYDGLDLGKHRIEIRATDTAGNKSDPERVEFTVISLGVAGL